MKEVEDRIGRPVEERSIAVVALGGVGRIHPFLAAEDKSCRLVAGLSGNRTF